MRYCKLYCTLPCSFAAQCEQQYYSVVCTVTYNEDERIVNLVLSHNNEALPTNLFRNNGMITNNNTKLEEYLTIVFVI